MQFAQFGIESDFALDVIRCPNRFALIGPGRMFSKVQKRIRLDIFENDEHLLIGADRVSDIVYPIQHYFISCWEAKYSTLEYLNRILCFSNNRYFLIQTLIGCF